MKKIILSIAYILYLFTINAQTVLLSENFDLTPTGAVTTSTAVSTYQIDNNTNCTTGDNFQISTTVAAGTFCPNCSGNMATIEYGATTCDQDATLIVGSFTPTLAYVNISFEYSFNYDVIGELFEALVFNETTGMIETVILTLTMDQEGNFSTTLSSLTIGDTYNLQFQYIGDYGFGLTLDDVIVTECISPGLCDPCTALSAPADDCGDAPLINLSQAFTGSTDCNYTVDEPTATCGGISLNNNSWLQFIAGSDTAILDWDITGGSACTGSSATTGIQLGIFEGSCGSLTSVTGSDCLNPSGGIGTSGTFNLAGLTIGNSYYIMIDGYAGDLCDYSITPISGVAIVPPNDSCFQAVPLLCGELDTASIILATDNDAPTGCMGGGTPGKGAWYSFIGTGTAVTFSTDNPSTNFDTEMNIYTGIDCNSLVCVAGDNDSGSATTSEITFTTIIGINYFIYIDGNGTAEGSFGISVSCVSCGANTNMIWD